ncbi:MAG: ABC transporter permease subunit [Pseudomonadota bacterium]|nr:ABC transporter permease subunit [Pseudomonadota bacterium]
MEKQSKYYSKRLALLPFIWIGLITVHLFGLTLLPDTPDMWVQLTQLNYTQSNLLSPLNTAPPATSALSLLTYLSNAIQGNLGTSIFYNQPVVSVISQSLPVTFWLAIKAFGILYLSGFVLAWGKLQNYAVACYLHKLNTHISAFPTCLLYSLVFVLAYHTSMPLNHFPHSLAMIFIVIRRLAQLTTFIHHCLLRETQTIYYQYALQRGVRQHQLIGSYLFRNGLIPVWIKAPKHLVNVIFTGTLATEVLFGIPGFGRMSFFAMKYVDYPLILGSLVTSSVIISLSQIIMDILHKKLSPHIHIGPAR